MNASQTRIFLVGIGLLSVFGLVLYSVMDDDKVLVFGSTALDVSDIKDSKIVAEELTCFIKATTTLTDENGVTTEKQSPFLGGDEGTNPYYAFIHKSGIVTSTTSTTTQPFFEVMPKIRCDYEGDAVLIVKKTTLYLQIKSEKSDGEVITLSPDVSKRTNELKLQFNHEEQFYDDKEGLKIFVEDILEKLDDGTYTSTQEFRIYGNIEMCFEQACDQDDFGFELIPYKKNILARDIPTTYDIEVEISNAEEQTTQVEEKSKQQEQLENEEEQNVEKTEFDFIDCLMHTRIGNDETLECLNQRAYLPIYIGIGAIGIIGIVLRSRGNN